jgi:hypothetical protein
MTKSLEGGVQINGQAHDSVHAKSGLRVALPLLLSAKRQPLKHQTMKWKRLLK